MHKTGRCALRKRGRNTVRWRTSAESQKQAATPLPFAGTLSQLNGFAFTNQEVEDDWCEPAAQTVRQQGQGAIEAARENPGTATTIVSTAALIGFCIGLYLGLSSTSGVRARW